MSIGPDGWPPPASVYTPRPAKPKAKATPSPKPPRQPTARKRITCERGGCERSCWTRDDALTGYCGNCVGGAYRYLRDHAPGDAAESIATATDRGLRLMREWLAVAKGETRRMEPRPACIRCQRRPSTRSPEIDALSVYCTLCKQAAKLATANAPAAKRIAWMEATPYKAKPRRAS